MAVSGVRATRTARRVAAREGLSELVDDVWLDQPVLGCLAGQTLIAWT
jgi:hypothetical protein